MDMYNDSLEVGSVFNDHKDIQQLCRSTAREQGKTVRVKKSDKSRLVITCHDETCCPYRVRATFSSVDSGKMWKITKMIDFHTCENTHTPIRVDPVQMSNLAHRVPNYLNLNRNTTAQEIQQVIAAREGIQISGSQARMVNNEMYRETLEYQLLTYDNRDPRSSMTCGRCLEYGHAQRDCYKELSCGRCGEKGHVNRTCTNEFVSIPTLHGQQPYVDWA